jgi:Spy/CpxP family protein refolding chaperone
VRGRILALTVAAGLVQAGAAAAQMMPMMTNQLPAQAHDQFTGPPALPTRHDRYLMKLASLRDKTLKTKAKDGGQLTPEHAASLQQELDRLNKEFGITAG